MEMELPKLWPTRTTFLTWQMPLNHLPDLIWAVSSRRMAVWVESWAS